jgi:hypothetical protein
MTAARVASRRETILPEAQEIFFIRVSSRVLHGARTRDYDARVGCLGRRDPPRDPAESKTRASQSERAHGDYKQERFLPVTSSFDPASR